MEKSIINFMYFGMNYPSEFIFKVWNDDPGMIIHLNEKFNSIYSKVGTFAFYTWFFELSQNHQVKLINWIEQNYCSGF